MISYTLALRTTTWVTQLLSYVRKKSVLVLLGSFTYFRWFCE